MIKQLDVTMIDVVCGGLVSPIRISDWPAFIPEKELHAYISRTGAGIMITYAPCKTLIADLNWYGWGAIAAVGAAVALYKKYHKTTAEDGAVSMNSTK